MAQVTGFDRHQFEAQRFNDCLDRAHQLLIRAADEWVAGHPELPPTTNSFLVPTAGKQTERYQWVVTIPWSNGTTPARSRRAGRNDGSTPSGIIHGL